MGSDRDHDQSGVTSSWLQSRSEAIPGGEKVEMGNAESILNSEEFKKMSDIFHVTKLGFLIPVQTIVEQEGIDILSQFDKDGHSPMHWAALGGHIHVLQYFSQLKAPLDVVAKNNLGAQPIHWACVNGHVQVVDHFIQNGVSIDAVDNKGCTPLIIAAQYGQTILAGFLMGKGARLHITDKEGDNALHWAAFKGHCELTRLLIYSGFNPKLKDNFGQYPLHLASLSGDFLTVQLLCEQDDVDVDIEDHNRNTPLKLAKGRKHKDIVNYFEGLQMKNKRFLPEIDFKSILFGPPGKTKTAFVFMLLMVTCYGYPCYLFRVLPYTFQFQTAHMFFFVNAIIMWYSLFKVHNMDPGFLPRNVDEYDQALKQVAHFAEWKQRGHNPLSRLCHTCRLVRPLRSKHSRITNRCVQHFDHYCPYIYNDVGYKNRHYFLVFVTTLTATMLFGDFFVWYVTKYIHTDYVMLLGGVVMGGFSVVNVFLCIFTVLQALSNITTNERLNARRYDYLRDGNGKFHNPFDQGWRRNLREFFHLAPAPLSLDHSSLSARLDFV